ncbi:uncharacterized protein Z520_11707 [Fonsecaea multimorphosa CBS 102226]|uniref:Uncharacterized protein n=1 Tax=Fonsecaea multimorphosa CBS 102226 TaxID=1442371 RepID=A0A0D2I5I4_9EURO|nr:uncharacterized protein Z520_11707 [Fonsecaea multimorphosa CBS 102226]KIX92531.1 hypothetical protein Z520_11707 [Fonsecaea multimorphosa CBS 102226]OAL17350.1 hypothetical protein AYO22_11717 [Fonsecaea multimorphosa]
MDSQLGSAPRQNDAENCAADHSNMSGASPSQGTEVRYKFELQELATYLRNKPDAHRGPGGDIVEFFLPTEQFQQFEEELERCGEFAGARCKYDYSYPSETLALRMGSDKHEFLVQFLNRRLVYFLDRAENDPKSSVSEFAASVAPFGSAFVRYPSKDGKGSIKRAPDLTFKNINKPRYPVLVGEVAYSQTTEELHKLAQEYIEKTEGHIRTVITIDLDYPTGKGVSLLVWRAKFSEDGKFEGVACDDAVEIRTKDGGKNPKRQAGLSLSLEDFACIGGVDEDADLQSVTVTVSTDDLYKALEIGEKADEATALRAQ